MCTVCLLVTCLSCSIVTQVQEMTFTDKSTAQYILNADKHSPSPPPPPPPCSCFLSPILSFQCFVISYHTTSTRSPSHLSSSSPPLRSLCHLSIHASVSFPPSRCLPTLLRSAFQLLDGLVNRVSFCPACFNQLFTLKTLKISLMELIFSLSFWPQSDSKETLLSPT